MKKMKVEDVSQLEDASGDLDEDPRLKQFTVKNPVKVSGHIKYTVTGVDSEGPFEDQRRYREFFALRNTLAQRWPGIYIPPIPEKQLVGNNDDEFVEERRSLLERFMKECGKYEYVTHSKEFKLFAREKGDIEKMLSALGKLSPMQILEKYRLNFNIDEDQEGSPVAHYKENIIDFQAFLRKALPVMEIQKRQLKKMFSVRDEQDASYVQIMTSLFKYEDNNVEFYSDSEPNKRILTNPDLNTDLKEKVDATFKGLRNPYKEAYLMLKGELLDLKGMSDALAGRESVVKMMSATESKKRDNQTELEKLSQGKTTLKSIFKSKSSKERFSTQGLK